MGRRGCAKALRLKEEDLKLRFEGAVIPAFSSGKKVLAHSPPPEQVIKQPQHEEGCVSILQDMFIYYLSPLLRPT